MRFQFGTADKTNPTCLHCGRGLKFSRFTGTRYCSEQHAEADRKHVQAVMLQRLEKHRERMSRYGRMDLSTPQNTSLSDAWNSPAREPELAPKPAF